MFRSFRILDDKYLNNNQVIITLISNLIQGLYILKIRRILVH